MLLRRIAILAVMIAPQAFSMHTPAHGNPRQGLVEMLLEYMRIRYKQADATGDVLYVSVERQRLFHIREGRLLAEYPVSTAAAGLGTSTGSGRTPTGLHRIHGKHGDGVPLGGVLFERRFTGRIAAQGVDGDLVTTRVLWLDGMEPGHNKGGTHDSRQRAIYIHGTPHVDRIGSPASKGCIRMRDEDVATLFDQVPDGALVLVLDN